MLRVSAPKGVLALKGMKLTRLTLRDLPMVDDQALAVLADLPELQRLYLHEIASISDSGLQHLASLAKLEVLDIWTVPQMTDATVGRDRKLAEPQGAVDPDDRRDRCGGRQDCWA